MENLLAGTLILGLVFACCGTSDFATYTDCGIDGYGCMESAAQSGCAPAKTMLADDVPMEAKITGQYDSYSCSLELRVLSKSEMYDMFRAEGADESMIQMFEASYGSYYSNIENKKASCIVEPSYMEDFFYYQEFEQYCSGDLLTYGYDY